MSDTDSFIEEVSEEVRRDRLYRLMRRWGWIPVLLVLLLVGGAAYNEWSKAKSRASAQLLGTEILAAIQIENPTARLAAYGAIATDGDNAALLALLSAGDAVEDGNLEQALETLATIAGNPSLSDEYRHLAELKLILAEGNRHPAEARLARLADIAGPGAPYRLLAEEQIALIEVSSGDTAAALQRLQAILADGELTAGLHRRVSQLIVALGGELQPT